LQRSARAREWLQIGDPRRNRIALRLRAAVSANVIPCSPDAAREAFPPADGTPETRRPRISFLSMRLEQ